MMNRIKGVVVFVLCVVVAFSLCACSVGEGTTTTKPEETTAKQYEKRIPISEAGIDMQQLIYANKITNLLLYNDTVTIITRGQSSYSEEQLFYCDNNITMTGYHMQEEDLYRDGWIKGLNYTEMDNGVQAYIRFDNLIDKPEFPYEEYISSDFSYLDLYVEEEGEDYYKIRGLSKDGYDSTTEIFYFNRDLVLTKHIRAFEDSSEVMVEIILNKEYNEYSEELIRKFDNPTKTITVIGSVTSGNSKTNVTSEIQLPDDWYITPVASEELAYYSNAESTIEYKYPGHGISHTIYATNTLG